MKPSKILFLQLAVLFVAMLGVYPASAQDAPPESQLAAPMPAGQPSVPPMPSDPIPAPQASMQMPAQQYSPTNNGTFDPCPMPRDAIASSPDDLAKVQEEIDRFTLCVARAQLLERLNETSSKSEGAIDSALGLGGAIPGMPNAQQNGLAPLPASALAGADVSPLDGNSAPVPDGSSAAPAAATAVPATASVAIEPAQSPWTIREIYGAGADIQAKLVSPEGDEVRVREGTKLRDGKGTVVRITPSVVTVRSGSETKDLDWSRS